MEDILDNDRGVLLDAEIPAEHDGVAADEKLPPVEADPTAEKSPDPAVYPQIFARLDDVQAGLAQIVEAVGKTGEQLSFLPGQIRNLGGRVDAVAVSVSETRYRSLLLDLLGIYDLLEQLIRSVEPTVSETSRPHLQNYKLLQIQLEQILEYNGLTRIPTAGPFTPDIHRAVDRHPCEEAAQAGQVVKVVRPGFRTALQVLRFAEVVVSYQVPRPPAPEPANEPAPAEPTKENQISENQTSERKE